MIERPRYIDRIAPFIDQDVVKVLTGMRRSGKSTLLEQIRRRLLAGGVSPDALIVRNFESARWADVDSWRSFYDMAVAARPADGSRAYYFFDEVQVVPEWERAVSALRVDVDCDIFLTGSNAKLLAGELATLLSGRYVAFEVAPFSFKEYVSAFPDVDARTAFETYRVLGGMPFIARPGFSRHDALAYLRDVLNSVVLKDVVQRKGLRDTDQFERVLTYFVSEVGTVSSVKNVANVLSEGRRPVRRESVYGYLEAACEAMVLAPARRYDLKGKDLLRGGEKYYVTDVGLREALLGTNAQRADLVLENIVFNELRSRGYAVSVGRNGEREIDFVAERDGSRIYVQVAYLLASEQTVEREFGAYRGIDDNYPKYVVTLDPVDWSRDGIIHRNVVDFLLDESW
jgi:hypothetical protein